VRIKSIMENNMTRIVSSLATLATSVMLLSSSAGFAQNGAYYMATPVTAPTKANVITSGTLWKCDEGVCVANKSTQRDVIMCQLVVQRLGTLSAFAISGTPVDSAMLAKCNGVKG